MMAQETPKARGSKHLTLGVMRLSRKVGVCLRPVSLWTTLKLTSTKGGYGLLVHRCDPPQESHGLVGVCALIRRISVSSVLVRTPCAILGAANHRRSFHRPQPPCYLPDLTLYEPPLLASLGKFPVKSLKALLLDIQSAREGVQALQGSTLKSALELAIPALSSPPHRKGRRTLLLAGLPQIEEFFGGHVQGSSQLSDSAKVGTLYLAGLDRREGSGTYTSFLSQPCLGPHPQPTDILHTLAYVGHARSSSLTANKAYHKLYQNSIITVYSQKKSVNFPAKVFKNCVRRYIMVAQRREIGPGLRGHKQRRRCKDHVESIPWVLRYAE